MPFEMPRPRPTAVRSPARPATVRLAPSAATELSWLLFACGHRDSVLALPPEVIGRADEFWDDGLGIQPEILVLADHFGCLTGWDIAPLLDLGGQAIPAPGVLRLATEDDEIRSAVTERIARLHALPALRRELSALLRAAWDRASDTLDRVGRPAVERSIARAHASLDHGLAQLSVIPQRHIAREDRYLPLTEAALAEGRLLVSPCYFAGVSGHVVDLPGAYSVAVGTGVSPDIAALRGDAERVAAQLKLLADPTRLLILTVLERGLAGVGDVARQVGVAQPTASVHIRQLREAGLLATEREGNVVRYRTDLDQLSTVLDQAQQALIPEDRLP
jgi:DNA-binding transcriptional ArsR family regulator